MMPIKLINSIQDGFMLLQLAVESNFTLEETFPLLNGLCVGALGKGGGDYVCPGFIFSYGPVVNMHGHTIVYSK